MNHADLIAIDIHTHAEVSFWNPFDNYGEEYDRAADKYFGSDRRPTIEETVAYYRERKIGLVMFTVDAESHMGRRRIPNEEIAKAARDNSDMMIAFASIIVEVLLRAIARITREQGMSAIIVEQHPQAILAISQQAVVLDQGRVIHRGSAHDLQDQPKLLDRLLGVSVEKA